MEKDYLTIDPSTLDTRALHAWLLSAVAPRPIGFVSSIDKSGNVNLSPFSYFNVFSINPPILIFSPALTGRGANMKDTHENAEEVREVVVNVVSYDMVEQMSLASSNFPKEDDEFVKSGLTPLASEEVQPPRVKEAPVSFECRVEEVKSLGKSGGAGNLVICQIVKMHVDKSVLGEDGLPDPNEMDLIGRMGGNGYVRASGVALFDTVKPGKELAVGVDQLPRSIRNSHILTGNNLGRLGSVAKLPTEEEVKAVMQSPEVHDILLEFETQRDEAKDALHRLGQEHLSQNDIHGALQVMMVVDHI